MLKATPLTALEVNEFGVGHINNYTQTSINTASGNGYVAYYNSSSCGYINGSWVHNTCYTSYTTSNIKYIVDAWANKRLNANDLSVDSTGYSARLLTKNEVNELSSNSWLKYADWETYWTMLAFVNILCLYVWF